MSYRAIKTGVAVLLVGGLVVTSAYFLINRNQQTEVSYVTSVVSRGNLVNKAVANGSVVPRREVIIKSRVSGVVEKLHVQPGEVIQRDSLIAKIRVVPDAVALNSAQARFETARISARNAELEFQRRAELFKEKLVAKDIYEQYRFELDIAREEEEGARSNLRLIREGGTGEDGTVSNEVRSTIDGTVLDIPIKEGDTVTETNNFNAGTTIAAIADMTDMVFTGTVDESEVGRIREGMTLEILVGAIEGETFTGELEYISPKGIKDEGSVQFEVRAAITTDSQLRAGYSASADVVLDRRDDVVVVDEKFLIFDGESTTGEDNVDSYVLRELPDGSVDRQKIEIGLSDGIIIEVVDGLKVGDIVRLP